MKVHTPVIGNKRSQETAQEETSRRYRMRRRMGMSGAEEQNMQDIKALNVRATPPTPDKVIGGTPKAAEEADQLRQAMMQEESVTGTCAAADKTRFCLRLTT